MTISDEHFEEIVQGSRPQSNDLSEAQRQELAEARAVRARLRAAFASAGAGEALTDRIRTQLADRQNCPDVVPRRRAHIIWRLTPLAAAAVIAVVAIVFVTNLSDPKSAQAELAAIHETNVQSEGQLHHGGDPARLATFLKDKLGTMPALPSGDDVNFCGCCTTQFRGQDVVSYMLRVDGMQMSIVIARIDPDTLGFRHKFKVEGQQFWRCGSGPCKMVAVVLGEYTYVAVGETGHEALTAILLRLTVDD